MFAHLSIVSLIFSLALVYVSPASAQKPVRKQEKTVSVAVAAGPVTVITDIEIRTIREYYVGKKPKPLPPGIAKNIARGKKVPPGIMRTRLPDDLVARLPRREGYEWAIANDVILLIDVSGIVREVLRDIF